MLGENVIFEDFKSKFQLSEKHLDVIEKLQELAGKYNLETSDLHDHWLAFLITKKYDPTTEPTVELLLIMQREVLAKKSSLPAKIQIQKDPDPVFMTDNSGLEDIMNMYNVKTPNHVPKDKKKPQTPETSVGKRSLSMSAIRAEMYSPKSATPPRIFKDRKNAGEVVLTFGDVSSASWSDSNHECFVEPLDPSNTLNGAFKFMFQKKFNQAETLNFQIQEMSDKLQELHGFESLGHVSNPTQEVVSVAGRVCCDNEIRANAHTVLLEGSRETSAGKLIPLDLSELKDYSLFPGQIVAMDGVNLTGKKFLVKKLHEGVNLPLPSLSPKNSVQGSSLNVMMAAGPFLTTDSLMFEPLTEFLSICQKEKPHVCILLGPFIDEEHEGIANLSSETYKKMFDRLTQGIQNVAEQLHIHMILVPSHRDIHSIVTYPQPPFECEIRSKFMHFVPNPSLLTINGIVFGITSTDVIFHLSNSEVHSSTIHTNRFKRIIHHLFSQQSFYPLYPPPEEILISFDHVDYFQLPLKPHILIVPSQFRYFVLDVDGCCCVNPGNLTKGESGGTYARMNMKIPAQNGSIVSNIAAQVIRI